MTLALTYARSDEKEVDAVERVLNHVGTYPFETDLLLADRGFYNERLYTTRREPNGMTTSCSCCKGEFADSEIKTYSRGTFLRLCPACYELVDPQSSPRSLETHPMREKDLELVLAWRNKPKIYEGFVEQDGPIEWDNHVAWYKQRPADREDYIIRYKDRRVGVVSLDENDFVSIYIGESPLWGQGIASRILEWLVQRYTPSRPLHAEIHAENTRSKRLFEQCGFAQSDRKNEWVIYQYDE